MALGMNQHIFAAFIATWGGTGKAPMAPGTVGSLAALPLWAVLQPVGPSGYIAVTLALCLLGTWAAEVYSTQVGVADPKQVVVDEVAGILVTLFGAPFSWPVVVAGFLLFRFFDILKPWPVGWLDRRLHGGVGIMADDLAAGALAWLVLNLFSDSLERMGGLLP